MPKRYYRKAPWRDHRGKNSTFTNTIRPGSDSKLKRVFDCIGVPEKKPFTPDPYQLEAVEAISHSDCLVTAPTGSGKTWIAEETIRKKLKLGHKTWYGTPLKALTNTIYAGFVKKFGHENVGILTGDIKENPDAPIIVGTTEILRNHLYDSMYSGEDLDTDLVILDEAHYLGDIDRGVVWEEIMIYLPHRIPLLMLSATIGNSDRISQWLESIRGGKCIVIEEKKRAVPLHSLFFHPSGTLFPLVQRNGYKRKGGLYKKVADYADNRRAPLLAPPGKLPPMSEIMKVLSKYRLLPAIFFMKSRMDCNNAIELCTEEILSRDPERKEKLNRRIEELLAEKAHIKNHKQRWNLEHLAVGAHHSGQLPAWKIVVETLMSEGLLDAIFATSTVAAGVNFPARSVVLLNSDKFNGVDFMPLNATEFSQMTGRAGRRGKDNIGFAIALPGKFMNLRLLAKLVDAPAGDITSQIRINFSMVLNLLLSHTPDQINELLKKSFATFTTSKNSGFNNKKKVFGLNGNNSYLWRDFLLHLDFLKLEGFVDKKNRLTEDGIWASSLRIDTPLLVAEGFRLNLFPQKDPALLAALVASFVNERESDDAHVDRTEIPKQLISAFVKIKRMLMPFAKNMMDHGFDVSPLYLQPAATVYTWATDTPWDKTCQFAGIAEGDLSRLIMRTADNLHHIAGLGDHFPDIAKTARQAIDLIMREPVLTFFQN